MANPIIRGFGRLTRFSGRDRRRQFWPYAGVVVALTYAVGTVVGLLAMIPMMAEMMEYSMAYPEATTVVAGPGHYSVQVDADAPGAPVPNLYPFVAAMAVPLLMAIGLLAAAVSRRLHDTGRSAWWGLAPVPFVAGCLALMPFVMERAIRGQDDEMWMIGLLFANNAIYFAALVVLIVLLCLPTKAGANRYGEQPA